MHALGAVGRAHQVEGTAGKPRALSRQIGGGGLLPGGEQFLERGDGVLDRDEAVNVGFGEVDGRVGHAEGWVGFRPAFRREWSPAASAAARAG
jgi:hypothetical protein